MMDNELDIRWVSDTLRDPPPERPVIVEGMLAEGELCVIGAPRGVGKSWLAANLALLVGRGEGFVMGVLPVRRSAHVLVAQGEMLHPAMARRWRMLCGTALPSSVAESFTPWRLRVERVRATTPSEVGLVAVEHVRGVLDHRVRRALEDKGFDVLIVDPWATFFAGNENDKGETEAALGELRQLALDLGTTVVILHHLGKSNDARDPEDLWRGSSRLADWASTRVTLLPHFTAKGAQEAGLSSLQARRYLDIHFLRRDEPTEGFVAHLGPDGWWSRAGSVSPTPGGRLSVEHVARSCRQAGGKWSSTVEARQSLGLSKQATAALLRQAVVAGAIFEGRGPHGTKTYTLVEPVGADWPEQVVDLAAERESRSEASP